MWMRSLRGWFWRVAYLLGTVCAGCGGVEPALNATTCSPGETRCAGVDILDRCEDGEWGKNLQVCEGACGELGGEATCSDPMDCVPNATRCAAERVLDTCSPDGRWGTQLEPCDGACTQSGGLAVCGLECRPGESSCVEGNSLRVCDDDGVWAAPEACADSACFDDRCQGDCAPNSHRCNEAGDSDVCDGTGTWRLETPCVEPRLLCSLTTGLCEDNPPYEVGLTDATATIATPIHQDFDATPIWIGADARLLKMGIMTAPGTTGGDARFVLYDAVNAGSDADPDYRPGEIVTTGGRTVTLRNGSISETDPDNLSTTLRGGALYFLGVRFYATGETVKMFERPGEVLPNGWAEVRRASFWTEWTDTEFPSFSTGRKYTFSAYIRVQNYRPTP